MPKKRALAGDRPPVATMIREARAAAGLTLWELAARLGTGLSTPQYLESRRSNPTVKSLAALAEALGGKLVLRIEV